MPKTRYSFLNVKILVLFSLVLYRNEVISLENKRENGSSGHIERTSKLSIIPLKLFRSQLEIDIPTHETKAISSQTDSQNLNKMPLGPINFLTAAVSKRVVHGKSDKNDKKLVCCPTIEEIVEPVAGKSESGVLLELFKSKDIRQQFHEISCHPEVINKPCHFISKSFAGQSRCVQQYSYSYSAVRDFGKPVGTGLGWRFEQIRVRSGCSCIVSSSPIYS